MRRSSARFAVRLAAGVAAWSAAAPAGAQDAVVRVEERQFKAGAGRITFCAVAQAVVAAGVILVSIPLAHYLTLTDVFGLALVVAALLGWLLFAEALGPLQAVGAGVALTGIVLAQRAAIGRP